MYIKEVVKNAERYLKEVRSMHCLEALIWYNVQESKDPLFDSLEVCHQTTLDQRETSLFPGTSKEGHFYVSITFDPVLEGPRMIVELMDSQETGKWEGAFRRYCIGHTKAVEYALELYRERMQHSLQTMREARKEFENA